ncbi:MAG: hypothetical protein ACRC1G_01790 [Bradyrhizobium sp.]|nr:hypothetical protein [Bradyrhizobium sp.]
MTFRSLLAVVVLLLGAPALAAPGPARRAPAATPPAPMVFYVVKGGPDACGRGCDSWIAVEGQIDNAAAPRFRKFLQQLGGRDLPIYLASPGGNLDQALAMGAMLRERRATARVGRTLVSDCGFEAQDSTACIKLKQSGRALRGDVFTKGANCNSACPYLLLGATNREIAPDALLAVHTAKVVVHFRGDVPPAAEVRQAAAARGRAEADSMLSAYITRMGADIGLFELARSIKFESQHVLTREEILRFRIDRRELAETPWKFENSFRSMVSKVAAVREDGERSWRLSQWRIICSSSEQFELNFQRPALGGGTTLPTVAISVGTATPQQFNTPPARLLGFEIWRLRMTRASVQNLASEAQFEFVESVQVADGKRVARAAKFSTDGLTSALSTLADTCPPPKNVALRQTVDAESAAK